MTRRNIQRKAVRGFSLIEILVVVVIMALLMAASLPALSSLTVGGQMNQTISEVTGLLEQARQYAVSHNTYVWVAFSTENTASGQNLLVAVVSSKNGMSLSSMGTAVTVPGTTLDLISPLRSYRQIKLSDAGTFTSAQIASLGSQPTVTESNSLENTSFSIQTPGKTSATTFSMAVQFQPNGEARNSDSPIDILEFAMQPQRSNTAADPNNIAVVRINGLTGQSSVYRR